MAVEQTAIKSRARGWHRSMALPKFEHAVKYREILKALGNQTCAPLKTRDGYVVKFRKKATNGDVSDGTSNHQP